MPIEWRVHTERVNANRRCAVRTRARQCGIWVQLACLIRAVVGAILLLVSGDVERNPGPVTRTCHECGTEVNIRRFNCNGCGISLHRRGRPTGTTQAAGFQVSAGRPEGTTQAAGFQVSAGRPEGTTQAAGFQVGTEGGRPESTTQAAGFQVSAGRPEGTTQAAGFQVSAGRPARYERQHMLFDGCELPSDWDVSEDTHNLTDEIL